MWTRGRRGRWQHESVTRFADPPVDRADIGGPRGRQCGERRGRLVRADQPDAENAYEQRRQAGGEECRAPNRHDTSILGPRPVYKSFRSGLSHDGFLSKVVRSCLRPLPRMSTSFIGSPSIMNW